MIEWVIRFPANFVPFTIKHRIHFSCSDSYLTIPLALFPCVTRWRAQFSQHIHEEKSEGLNREVDPQRHICLAATPGRRWSVAGTFCHTTALTHNSYRTFLCGSFSPCSQFSAPSTQISHYIYHNHLPSSNLSPSHLSFPRNFSLLRQSLRLNTSRKRRKTAACEIASKDGKSIAWMGCEE